MAQWLSGMKVGVYGSETVGTDVHRKILARFP